MEHLQYPIGKLVWGNKYTFNQTKEHIQQIETFPLRLIEVINSFSNQQYLATYRENGWNGIQVINHIADSHINAYCRLKLALTETNPTIKPYHEELWATLPDYTIDSIPFSIEIIKGIHFRMSIILYAMTEQRFQLTYYHPDNKIITNLADFAQAYAWHGNHHLAHLKIIKQSV
jgi:hypothetical protein